MRCALAVPVVAMALVAMMAGCSSGGIHASSGGVQTGAGGTAGLAAAPTASSNGIPALRLGVMATVTDGIALVAVQDQLFREDLGASVALDTVPFASPSAEGAALAVGQLDAAYISPLEAIRAWQSSRGGVRIVAGAAATDGHSTEVLAVSTRILTAHPGEVVGLLKGEVQADELLNVDKTSAQAALESELSTLGQRISTSQLGGSFAHLLFTYDPLAASIAAQAQQAAATGTLKPVAALGAIYDVGPLNKLLRAAGMNPVAG
jgi:ABC-type nitrate/sulfonate/bicarbonate transport system substrate-binding protein